MKKIKFLEKYINTPSPSGYEMLLGGQKVWIDYVKPFCHEVKTNAYGNAYAFFNQPDPEKITVLLDAHGDEIGFFVFDITDKGFLKVGRLGGSDITITPSSRVDIWGEKGCVKGVFGHPAIHVQESDMKIKIENIFVDLGCSTKEEVEELGITVGTPITMSDGFMELGNFYCGRSLDDKIGGFITSQVLRKLQNEKDSLNFNLVVVNAVQEEVGLHGAQMASGDIKPDIVIAIDVTHDTCSPAYNIAKQGTIVAGKGIVLANGPSIHKKLFGALKDIAKHNDIPYQLYAFGRSSGTNADSYAYPHGIPTALLKMGMRYMHTTVETVHKNDVKSAVNLLVKFLESYGSILNEEFTKNLLPIN